MWTEWTFEETQSELFIPCSISSTGGRKSALQINTKAYFRQTKSAPWPEVSQHIQALMYPCHLSQTWPAALTLCFQRWLTSATAILLVKFSSYFDVLTAVFPRLRGWQLASGCKDYVYIYVTVPATLHCMCPPVHVFSLWSGHEFSGRSHCQYTAK